LRTLSKRRMLRHGWTKDGEVTPTYLAYKWAKKQAWKNGIAFRFRSVTDLVAAIGEKRKRPVVTL